MCADRDPPPCEHGELIALVSRQQDQVARLTATIKELRRQLATRERIDARATVETMTDARLVTVLCADAAMQRTLIARHCVQESTNHCHPLSGLGRALVRAGRRRARIR